jgi:hypothetical protein
MRYGECTLDVGEDAFDVGHATVLNEALHGAANHSVLAHEDNSVTAEGDADFVHLLGCDIVDRDDEDTFVSLEKRLQLVEVRALVSVLALLQLLDTGVLLKTAVFEPRQVTYTHCCGCV